MTPSPYPNLMITTNMPNNITISKSGSLVEPTQRKKSHVQGVIPQEFPSTDQTLRVQKFKSAKFSLFYGHHIRAKKETTDRR